MWNNTRFCVLGSRQSFSLLTTSRALVQNTWGLGVTVVYRLEYPAASSLACQALGPNMTQRLGSSRAITCGLSVSWSPHSMGAQFWKVVSQVGTCGEQAFSPLQTHPQESDMLHPLYSIVLVNYQDLREENSISHLEGKQAHNDEEHAGWEILLCYLWKIQSAIAFNSTLSYIIILNTKHFERSQNFSYTSNDMAIRRKRTSPISWTPLEKVTLW